MKGMYVVGHLPSGIAKNASYILSELSWKYWFCEITGERFNREMYTFHVSINFMDNLWLLKGVKKFF